MTFEMRGNDIRALAKSLVLDFMRTTEECRPGNEGMKQVQIFKRCGFDWGDYPKASSSNQQYWIVALLKELESEGKIERICDSGPWRLL